jgi:hypothetical protein
MGDVILELFTVAQQAQMLFGPAEMELDIAPRPFVVGMFSDTVAHDAGDYCECLIELH